MNGNDLKNSALKMFGAPTEKMQKWTDDEQEFNDLVELFTFYCIAAIKSKVQYKDLEMFFSSFNISEEEYNSYVSKNLSDDELNSIVKEKVKSGV